MRFWQLDSKSYKIISQIGTPLPTGAAGSNAAANYAPLNAENLQALEQQSQGEQKKAMLRFSLMNRENIERRMEFLTGMQQTDDQIQVQGQNEGQLGVSREAEGNEGRIWVSGWLVNTTDISRGKLNFKFWMDRLKSKFSWKFARCVCRNSTWRHSDGGYARDYEEICRMIVMLRNNFRNESDRVFAESVFEFCPSQHSAWCRHTPHGTSQYSV